MTDKEKTHSLARLREEAELFGEDQFGNRFGPLDPSCPKASLLDVTGANTAVPMYVDKRDGSTWQTGYVVKPPRGSDESEQWVHLYWDKTEPWEKPA